MSCKTIATTLAVVASLAATPAAASTREEFRSDPERHSRELRPQRESETQVRRDSWVMHQVVAYVEIAEAYKRGLVFASAWAHSEAHAAQRSRHHRPRRVQVTHPRVSVQGNGRCGGDLPPCYVMQRESGGSLTAENPVSTASGKWQFLDGTWNGYGGYAHASDAPESVQDARAREVWAGGAGCSNWSAC